MQTMLEVLKATPVDTFRSFLLDPVQVEHPSLNRVAHLFAEPKGQGKHKEAHQPYFKAAKLPWPPAAHADASAGRSMQGLTERAAQVVEYCNSVYAPSETMPQFMDARFPLEKIVQTDGFQWSDFVPARHLLGQVVAKLDGGRPFLLDGAEQLQLAGFDFDSETLDDSFKIPSHKLAITMAANAASGFLIAPLVIALLTAAYG